MGSAVNSVQQRRTVSKGGGTNNVPKYVKLQVAYLTFLAAGKGYSRRIPFDLGMEVMDPIVKPSYQLLFLVFLDNLSKGYQWNRKKRRKPLTSNEEIRHTILHKTAPRTQLMHRQLHDCTTPTERNE